MHLGVLTAKPVDSVMADGKPGSRATSLIAVVVMTAFIWGLLGLGHLVVPDLLPSFPRLIYAHAPIPQADYHRCANQQTELWTSCDAGHGVVVTRCAQTHIGEPHGFIKAPYPCAKSDARPLIPTR